MSDIRNVDVQHGIDDNPNDDAAKGLELGAFGGGAAGAAQHQRSTVGGCCD